MINKFGALNRIYKSLESIAFFLPFSVSLLSLLPNHASGCGSPNLDFYADMDFRKINHLLPYHFPFYLKPNWMFHF